jgi:thiol-disulfide isomerase/thioredoxin/uncharacterized membrane protein YphA (DoxX/SURF4 family)
MEVFLLIVRLILVGIFGLAGIGKLFDLKGSEKAVKDFGVPDILAKPFSLLLPLAEITVAGLLLFVETSWVGAIGGSVLLLIFIGGMAWQMFKGNAPDCHCFGQIHSEPVSPKSLIRNVIFAVAAIFLVFNGREDQGLNLFASGFEASENNTMQVIIGLLIVAFLGAIIYFLKQISEQQTQIIRRLQVVEVLAQEGGREMTRENIGHPHDGLPVGAPAPDFSVPDVKGKEVEFEHILAKGKPILFFFVSPTCSPCAALLPEIEKWKNELGERLNFVFVTNGKAKENIDKFGDVAEQILLEKDRAVALKFGAVWTPTVLLVNTDGTIGSRIAAGDEAIRELIEKIKVESEEKETFYITNGKDDLRKSKIGEKVPEFTMEDLQGRKIGKDDFLGKKTLAAFWSTTCPHCVNMIEDLREWEKQKGQNEPNLVVFSEGEEEEHKKLELDSPILLEKGYKVAEKLGMIGTPSAVLINENGEIISETAVGSVQVWALLGKNKLNNGKTN